MVVALIGLFVMLNNGKDSSDDASSTGLGGGEVFLEPADSSGTDPFSQSVAADTPTSTVPLGEPVALGKTGVTAPALGVPSSAGTVSYTGGTPGLYGGTRNQRACDPAKLKGFLADNPDKAAAWAGAQGISVDAIPGFIDSLTPAVLRSDTRVTNHGYKNGKATPHQSVLQAGTAVLVDQYGVPRARCACGNPLNPPEPAKTKPVYQGTPWTSWNPAAVTVIVQNTTVIKVITLIDITTGQPFGRPTGAKPGTDVDLPKLPTQPTGSTTTAASTPSTTQPTSSSQFKLADWNYNVAELKDNWTVQPSSGVATFTLPAGTTNYDWTVPQTLDPAGTKIEWGGNSTGDLNVRIAPAGSGITFADSDLDVNVTGTAGKKSTTITVTGDASEVTLTYNMGFSVSVNYIYRRA